MACQRCLGEAAQALDEAPNKKCGLRTHERHFCKRAWRSEYGQRYFAQRLLLQATPMAPRRESMHSSRDRACKPRGVRRGGRARPGCAASGGEGAVLGQAALEPLAGFAHIPGAWPYAGEASAVRARKDPRAIATL